MYLQSEGSSIAAKASYEAVSLDEGALHPIFATTSDDWIFLEVIDEYEQGEPPQSQEYEPTDNEQEPRQSQEAIRLQNVDGPPEAPLLASNSPILPNRCRLRRKHADPATEPPLQRIHQKLRNENELYKLHQKHYHMKLDQFKWRASHLKIPKDIYDLFDMVVKKCHTCSRLTDKPCRSRISGLRAEIFGDITFSDLGQI